MAYRTRNIIFEARLLWFMDYRTRNITFVACIVVYGLQNEEYYCWSVLVSLYGLYISYNAELIRSVSIKHTDRTNKQHTVPWCHNEMHAPYVLRIRTVSNSDGLYGAYDPSTALSIGTVTIRTDRTNRNTLCFDVIMRCTLGMCSIYRPLTTLTVCTERMIRQLLLTVRNSATVLDMTVDNNGQK